MTTGLAPPTIPSVETGMPPREWSDSVLASNPPQETPATFSEIRGRADNPNMTEEKSQEKPQAPKELEKQQAEPSKESKLATRNQPSESTSAAVAQTAKQYLPERVGKTDEYATQTAAAAASHLPISLGSKDPVNPFLSSEQTEEPHVSLPSTELKGAQPLEHTGGVGALPGNLSESSVALLPDERQEKGEERRPASRQRRDTIKPSATGGDVESPESEKEEGEAKVPRDSAVPGNQLAQQPDVPPKNTETRTTDTVESNSIARSGPEVESQKETDETENQEGTGTVAPVDIVGATPRTEEPRKDTERSNLASGKSDQGKDPSQDVRRGGDEEGGTIPTGKVEGGHDGEYRPAQLHPPPPGAGAAEYQTSFGAQQQQQAPTTRAGKRESMGAEKKPGFMTMVKGEMKIIAGKVSGDEQKVEEGKKLVHGDA